MIACNKVIWIKATAILLLLIEILTLGPLIPMNFSIDSEIAHLSTTYAKLLTCKFYMNTNGRISEVACMLMIPDRNTTLELLALPTRSWNVISTRVFQGNVYYNNVCAQCYKTNSISCAVCFSHTLFAHRSSESYSIWTYYNVILILKCPSCTLIYYKT